MLACRETRETSQKYTSYEEGASRSHQVANRRITGGSPARLVRKCTYSFPLSSTIAHRETGYLRLMRFGEHRRLPSRARRGFLLVRLGVRCSNDSERCHCRQSSTYFSAPLHEYAPSSFNSSAKHLFCVSGRGIVQATFCGRWHAPANGRDLELSEVTVKLGGKVSPRFRCQAASNPSAAATVQPPRSDTIFAHFCGGGCSSICFSFFSSPGTSGG